MLKILAILAVTLITLPAAVGDDVKAGKHHQGEFKQRLLEKFDTDKDGKLSESERAAAKAACKQHRLDNFDADKDGKLSETERDAARAARSAKLKANHPKLFAKIDTNSDGVISREEAQAARERRREHHQEGK